MWQKQLVKQDDCGIPERYHKEPADWHTNRNASGYIFLKSFNQRYYNKQNG